MTESHTPSPRQRMKILLAIPDSDRTDEEWDELNELEISMAPVNRIGAPEPGSNHSGRRHNPAKFGQNKMGAPSRPNKFHTGNPAAQGNSAPTADGTPTTFKKPARKFFKRIGKKNVNPASASPTPETTNE